MRFLLRYIAFLLLFMSQTSWARLPDSSAVTSTSNDAFVVFSRAVANYNENGSPKDVAIGNLRRAMATLHSMKVTGVPDPLKLQDDEIEKFGQATQVAANGCTKESTLMKFPDGSTLTLELATASGSGHAADMMAALEKYAATICPANTVTVSIGTDKNGSIHVR